MVALQPSRQKNLEVAGRSARFSTVVARGRGARHPLDRVQRPSVPAGETPRFPHDLGGAGDRSTATDASTSIRQREGHEHVAAHRGLELRGVIVHTEDRGAANRDGEILASLDRIGTGYPVI